jgi:sterol desaturase/sphingolipid hydroxylase (fatty acid hydroxylase superfamily)
MLLLSLVNTDWLKSVSRSLRFFWTWPLAAKVLTAIVLIDFMLYWWHRALHHWFWYFHRWHHSIFELNWLSGARHSFTETLFHFLPFYLVLGTMFRLPVWEGAIVGSWFGFVECLSHVNSALYPDWMDLVFVTPQYHRVHHGTQSDNTNFGVVFSVWDRLFGTYRPHQSLAKDFTFGSMPGPISLNSHSRMMIGI